MGRHVSTEILSLFLFINCSISRPKLILDADGRIVAVLLGRPDGGDWDDVKKEARRVMDQVRARGERRGVFIATSKSHRRGNFYTLQAGFTKGLGQKV
jgi:hypothetical protein